MSKLLTVTGVDTPRGEIEISVSIGDSNRTISYSSKAAIKRDIQELEDLLERYLLMMCIAHYAYQSNDAELTNLETGMIGKSILIDISEESPFVIT